MAMFGSNMNSGSAPLTTGMSGSSTSAGSGGLPSQSPFSRLVDAVGANNLPGLPGSGSSSSSGGSSAFGGSNDSINGAGGAFFGGGAGGAAGNESPFDGIRTKIDKFISNMNLSGGSQMGGGSSTDGSSGIPSGGGSTGGSFMGGGSSTDGSSGIPSGGGSTGGSFMGGGSSTDGSSGIPSGGGSTGVTSTDGSSGIPSGGSSTGGSGSFFGEVGGASNALGFQIRVAIDNMVNANTGAMGSGSMSSGENTSSQLSDYVTNLVKNYVSSSNTSGSNSFTSEM